MLGYEYLIYMLVEVYTTIIMHTKIIVILSNKNNNTSPRGCSAVVKHLEEQIRESEFESQ